MENTSSENSTDPKIQNIGSEVKNSSEHSTNEQMLLKEILERVHSASYVSVETLNQEKQNKQEELEAYFKQEPLVSNGTNQQFFDTFIQQASTSILK